MFCFGKRSFLFSIFSSKFIVFPLWFVFNWFLMDIFSLAFVLFETFFFFFFFFAVLLLTTFWNIYFLGGNIIYFLINCVYLCWLFCGFVLLIFAQKGRYLIHVKYSTRYSYFHDSYTLYFFMHSSSVHYSFQPSALCIFGYCNINFQSHVSFFFLNYIQ